MIMPEDCMSVMHMPFYLEPAGFSACCASNTTRRLQLPIIEIRKPTLYRKAANFSSRDDEECQLPSNNETRQQSQLTDQQHVTPHSFPLKHRQVVARSGTKVRLPRPILRGIVLRTVIAVVPTSRGLLSYALLEI